MSNNLEAKITKQMRNLIEIKLAKQNETPEQAIADMDVFIQDFNSHEKYLINQYAKYIKHLLDNNYGTKNAWEKFLAKLEQKKLSNGLNKAINKENNADKQAFKRSLEDLKEYDRISKILKSPVHQNDVEEIDLLNDSNEQVFNPFDHANAMAIADDNIYENENDEWTLNSNEFETIDTNNKDFDTLERNVEFSDTQDVEQLKEEFSKIKTKMQNKINDLIDQVDQLKFKLANYEIDKYGDYEIVDESDEDLSTEEDILKAQRIPVGQQTIDFSVDHTNDEPKQNDSFNKTEEQTMVLDDLDDILNDDAGFEKTAEQTAVFEDEPEENAFEKTSEQTMLADDDLNDEETFEKTSEDTTAFAEPEDGETTAFFKKNVLPELDKALEELDDDQPTAYFPFNTVVTDKDGKEYRVAGTKKDPNNRTEYLVRNDDGETFTFKPKDLTKKD